MKETINTSNFGEGISEYYIYESKVPSNKVLFILKGLYGYHFELDDKITDLSGLKWDSSFVRNFQNHINVVCINSSRKPISDPLNINERAAAYEGKSFNEEVTDLKKVIEKVLEVLQKKGIKTPEIYFLGKSFGGTLLLGLKDLYHAKITFMLGSGCGKSPTTKKTILQTMPGEDTLLKTIKNYDRGELHFFRGDADEVVPKDSQEKIVNTKGPKIVKYTVLRGVDHEFEKVDGKSSLGPNTYLRNAILSAILSN